MTSTGRTGSGGADLLTIGFGTAAAMWAVGYCCRLTGDAVPPVVVFVLLLLCQLVGGFVAGWLGPRGLRGGVYAGLLTGTVNLLIVGSLIGGDTPNAIRSGAPFWIAGTLILSAGLGGVGAAVGGARRRTRSAEPDWPGLLAIVAAATTFLLLAAGGLVTGFDEGLAVVDWPNTEGYNMFLYPLARMTGGIYLEHSHRLLGTLVGLTVLAVAIHVTCVARRRAAVLLAWPALGLVVVQGILGGLRVTGRFTLSTQPADTDPSVVLAIVHGVVGQLVFTALAALAVLRSRAWATAPAATSSPSARTDRTLTIALLILLLGQLVLGAIVRHFTWALDILRYGMATDPERLRGVGQWALHLHITIAVLVAVLAVAVGVRAWGLYTGLRALPRLGVTLLVLTGVQIGLGVAALIVVGNDSPDRRPQAVDVAITTAHQVVGAALLAVAAMVLVWNRRVAAGRR